MVTFENTFSVLLMMDTRDARMLGQEAQEEIRRQAIKLLKQGLTRIAVAVQLDVSRQHVGAWRRSYAPKGQTLVVRQSAKRFHASIISAINNQGKMQWMALKNALDADTFIDFLKRLIRHRKRKIFLIVDNLRVHHSKLVKAWLEKQKHRIELFYLPSYSPELNPDEYLNRTLKHEAFKGGPAHDQETLNAKVNVAMFMLSIQPHKISARFQHPLAQYAA